MIRLKRCFPELGGFAVVDPERLAAFFGGRAAGCDLLERFVSSGDGDRVAKEGIVLPLLGIEAGYYDLVFRAPDEPSAIERASVSARGWVLGSERGELLLCGLGYLKDWRPDHARHGRVSVAPGWYAVEVRGALVAGEDDCDGVIELVLAPSAARPRFSAALDRELGLGS
jgi:hypothetical protein